MVGILLKIGKQSENVGEEEVFGRFCIRDVTENPSGGLLRRADIRRISALRRNPPDGFSLTSRMQKRPKTSSSLTFSDCFPIFNKIPTI